MLSSTLHNAAWSRSHRHRSRIIKGDRDRRSDRHTGGNRSAAKALTGGRRRYVLLIDVGESLSALWAFAREVMPEFTE
jgi:hypothetical protein